MFFPKLRFLLASPVYIYKDIFLLCVVWPVESSVPEQVFLSAWSLCRSAWVGAERAASELSGILLLPDGLSHRRTWPACEHTKQ